MNTRLATRQIRLQQWMAIIRDKCESGETVADYCRNHGLSVDAYYYWLRKAKEAALEQGGFVRLDQTPDVRETDAEHLTVTVNEAIIQVEKTTSMELLAKVVRALRDV